MKCAFSALDKSSVVVSVDFWNKKLIPTLHKYRSFDNSCVIATTESAAVLTFRFRSILHISINSFFRKHWKHKLSAASVTNYFLYYVIKDSVFLVRSTRFLRDSKFNFPNKSGISKQEKTHFHSKRNIQQLLTSTIFLQILKLSFCIFSLY